MLWPKSFPKACPPIDAKSPNLRVYLLVHPPIEIGDFDSLKKRQPDTIFATAEFECQAHGLSVFEQIEHVRRVQNRVRRLRAHAIAVGQLTAETGVIKPTSSQFGDSHRTWCIPEHVQPWTLFQIVKPVGES
jgi:hypothetical protein